MSKTTLTKQAITNQTMTGNINSILIDKEQMDNVTFQAIWSGTPTGNLNLMGSNDVASNSGNVGTTTALVNATQVGSSVAAGGAAGSKFIPDPNVASAAIQCYRYVQLQYAFTSSTGTLNAYFHGQGSF